MPFDVVLHDHLHDSGFDLRLDGENLLSHRISAPAFSIGRGKASVNMLRGNFDISDDVQDRLVLDCADMRQKIRLWNSARPDVILTISFADNVLKTACSDPAYNRLFVTMNVGTDEHIWGGGEQMSYLARLR